MQKLLISDKYVVFPVRRSADQQKVLFRLDGQTVYDLDVRLDAAAPDFSAYVDVSRFAGRELTLTLLGNDGAVLPFTTASSVPDDTEAEALTRPALHFTVKNGWNNDPNGLTFFEGKYHMYFQYNPCGPMWGNMHWGHAVSSDLLHWTEEDIALYPDEYGTVYSGCAIPDTKNLLGLKEGDHVPLLFYYTAAGSNSLLSEGKPATQRLAYTSDGGATYRAYPAPILEHIVDYNRDPKVVWVEEVGRYVMVLYLTGNEYAFFASDDLKTWELTQKLSIPFDSECPNLVSVPVEGENRSLWVFFGAAGVYTVGEFCEGQYVPLQDFARPNESTGSYAGQCFDGLPGGQAIRIDWLVSNMQGRRFSQAMTVPLSMSLVPQGGRYILREQPIPALDTYLSDDPAGCRALDVRLSIPDASALPAPVVISLFGKQITLDASANRVTDGKFACALSHDASDPHRPLSLRLIADAASVEVFADSGLAFFATRACPDPLAAAVSLTGLSESAGVVSVKGIRL